MPIVTTVVTRLERDKAAGSSVHKSHCVTRVGDRQSNWERIKTAQHRITRQLALICSITAVHRIKLEKYSLDPSGHHDINPGVLLPSIRHFWAHKPPMHWEPRHITPSGSAPIGHTRGIKIESRKERNKQNTIIRERVYNRAREK